MANTTPPVLRHVRRWLRGPAAAFDSDAELVRRFAVSRDEAAFAALVDRHGPMVLGTARRATGDGHLAEDVLQATFLVLARQAGRLRRPQALPGWLHRTALHLGLKAARARNRRQRVEASLAAPRPAGPPDLEVRELLAVLDDELARLPESLRLPLVFCCLEGLSLDEAAARLGWTPGSVRGRLQRGRQRLHDRLARRGLTFSLGAGAALLLVPEATVAEPLRTAVLRAATGEHVPPAVIALAATVPSAARVGMALSFVTAVGLLTLGVTLLSGRHGGGQPVPPAKDTPPVASKGDSPGGRLPAGAVAQLGYSPHRIGNSAFALIREGKEIITASPEGIIRRFDAGTGRLLERRQLTPRTDVSPAGQTAAQLSADGRMVALSEMVAGKSRVSVWDIPAGKPIYRRDPEKEVRLGGFALAPDGQVLAVREDIGQRTVLRVYDTATGTRREFGELEYNTYGMEFSADSKRLVVSQTSARGGSGPHHFLACFDVPSGKQIWKLPAQADRFAVSADGRTVVFAQYGRHIFRIIQTDPGTAKATESEQPQSYGIAHPNVAVAFAPDNRTLVISHFDALISWDIRAGKEVGRIRLPRNPVHGYGPELGGFSADGKTVLMNREGLQRWDLSTGKEVFESVPGSGLGGPVEFLAFTPGDTEIFAAAWSLNSARWDVATGRRTASHREKFGHRIVMTPGGLRSVWADDYKAPHEIVVYDPVAGKALKTVTWIGKDEIGINGLRAYALAADGRTLSVLQSDEPGAKRDGKSYVTVHDIVTDRRLARWTLPGTYSFNRSPFSPCGRWLACGGKVYHVRTGTELFTPAGKDGERLAAGIEWASETGWFSPDGRLMAGRLDGADVLAVWELASGQVLARFPGGERIAQVVFSPDGRTVALVDGRGVHIHDLLTDRRLTTFIAPDVTCEVMVRGAGPQTVAFSADGRRLATGHRDGTVIVWQVPVAPPIEGGDVWAGLSDKSPATARSAIDRAVRDPAAAIKTLTAKFRPAPDEPDPKLASLIADLDSNTFAKRESASRRLRELGEKVGPALRQALSTAKSPEAQRRLRDLLANIRPAVEALPVSGETLRGVRAIEVLERVGTREASKLLQKWAEQGQDPRLAAEASFALGRIGRPGGPIRR